jgi:DNA-binding NarL/FixJ family response regulator
MARRIAVSILSESRLLREALAVRLSLDQQAQFVFTAAASNVHGLLVQLRGCPLDVLLVHADTEAFSGGVIWEIKSLLPAARVIALGFQGNDAETLRWFEAGALAYLPCAASYASLRETICAAAAGCPTYSREVLLGVARRMRTLAEAD